MKVTAIGSSSSASERTGTYPVAAAFVDWLCGADEELHVVPRAGRDGVGLVGHDPQRVAADERAGVAAGPGHGADAQIVEPDAAGTARRRATSSTWPSAADVPIVIAAGSAAGQFQEVVLPAGVVADVDRQPVVDHLLQERQQLETRPGCRTAPRSPARMRPLSLSAYSSPALANHCSRNQPPPESAPGIERDAVGGGAASRRSPGSPPAPPRGSPAGRRGRARPPRRTSGGGRTAPGR